MSAGRQAFVYVISRRTTLIIHPGPGIGGYGTATADDDITYRTVYLHDK